MRAKSARPTAVTIAAARRSRAPISNFRLDFSALQFMTIPKPTANEPVIWGESAEDTHDQEERSNAWFDARLAAAVPPDYRARREVSRHTGGRHPLGRRPDRPHHLRRNPQARTESLADAAARRHQARRPRRHHRL